MKKLFLAASLLVTAGLSAQLTTTPSGGNKKAMVGEQIGLTKVEINYDRPGVKGREGKIYGTSIVHNGFIDQQFGPSKAAPWRAGANENTTIEFSTDVTIEGKPLKAGKYGLFLAYDPNASTLIFSKNTISWGSYFYNPEEDALRVTIKPVALDRSVEWLKYEFTNQTDNAATISLMWEKMSFPFRVETDLIKNQVELFRSQLRNRLGFTWQSWNQAAAWCVQNKTNLDEALLWADTATSAIFGGNMEFQTHVTKANVLKALGRTAEADSVMKKAMPLGNMIDLHQYGRQLLNQKKTAEALEVFKLNYSKNPDQFTTLVGLARGYSGTGDFKNALKFMTKALSQAPDDLNKKSVEGMIEKLKNKQDVN